MDIWLFGTLRVKLTCKGFVTMEIQVSLFQQKTRNKESEQKESKNDKEKALLVG